MRTRLYICIGLLEIEILLMLHMPLLIKIWVTFVFMAIDKILVGFLYKEYGLFARLAISLINHISHIKNCWKVPALYRVILISGLSELVVFNEIS